MARIAIGALGKGNKNAKSGTYDNVKYKFSDGKSFTTPYAIDALIQHSEEKFDKTIILLTTGARGESWDMMKVFLEGNFNAGRICELFIENGNNEAQLWDIFDAIVHKDNISEGDELFIDITNGLRHLPVLLLIACSYLQVVRGVKIKSLSYGAFDLGVPDEKKIVQECDVIDLLPYVALFDWSIGVEAFKRSGDARILAEQLRKSANVEAAQPLKDVADKLDNITLALELARPEEAAAEIKSLTSKLKTLQENSTQYARPFSLLRDTITADLEKITKLSATGLSSIENKLQTQRNLIEWYKDKNRLAMAILLTREWLLSKFMIMQGKTLADIENYTTRKEMAGVLNNWDNRPLAPQLHDAFSEVVTLRNSIAHLGQSGKPMKAKALRDAIKEVLKQLSKIN